MSASNNDKKTMNTLNNDQNQETMTTSSKGIATSKNLMEE